MVNSSPIINIFCFFTFTFRYNYYPNLTLFTEQLKDRIGKLPWALVKSKVKQYIKQAQKDMSVPGISNSPIKNDTGSELYSKVIARLDEWDENIETFRTGKTNISEYKYPLEFCWQHLKQDLSLGK